MCSYHTIYRDSYKKSGGIELFSGLSGLMREILETVADTADRIIDGVTSTADVLTFGLFGGGSKKGPTEKRGNGENSDNPDVVVKDNIEPNIDKDPDIVIDSGSQPEAQEGGSLDSDPSYTPNIGRSDDSRDEDGGRSSFEPGDDSEDSSAERGNKKDTVDAEGSRLARVQMDNSEGSGKGDKVLGAADKN